MAKTTQMAKNGSWEIVPRINYQDSEADEFIANMVSLGLNKF